jgi:hypothetical protein
LKDDDEVFSERRCRVTKNLHSPSSGRVHDEVRHFQLWQAVRFFDEPFVYRDHFAVDLGDRPAKMLFDSVIQPI